MVLNEPLEVIKEGIFIVREMGSIKISYLTMDVCANEVKEGGDGVMRSQEMVKYHLCWIPRYCEPSGGSRGVKGNGLDASPESGH